MEQAAPSMAQLEGRFNELLHVHDAAFRASRGPFLDGDLPAHNKLAKIVAEIADVISAAACVRPATGHEIAVLIRMAIVNLGIDEEGERPGHAALRAALSALEALRH